MKNTIQIKARSIYGEPRKPFLPTDPPEGCLFAFRYHDGGRQYKIGEPWPELAIGQELEIETTNHYIWHGTVEQRIDEDTIVFRPRGSKVAMPLPPVIEGQPYRLPWMSGDAWSRRPEAATVLLIQDQPYKVIGKPKPVRGSSDYVFTLRAVETAAYATRPGRVAIKDLTDPNHDSFRFYHHNIGRVVKIGEEFLYVEKVSRVPYGDGEGSEIFGYNTFGEGHFVGSDKAAKLGAKWDAKEKVRSIEHSLRVARQDLDYGGNPEAIPGLEAELEKARKATV